MLRIRLQMIRCTMVWYGYFVDLILAFIVAIPEFCSEIDHFKTALFFLTHKLKQTIQINGKLNPSIYTHNDNVNVFHFISHFVLIMGYIFEQKTVVFLLLFVFSSFGLIAISTNKMNINSHACESSDDDYIFFFFVVQFLFFCFFLYMCNTNNQNAKFTTKNLAHHSYKMSIVFIYHFPQMH